MDPESREQFPDSLVNHLVVGLKRELAEACKRELLLLEAINGLDERLREMHWHNKEDHDAVRKAFREAIIPTITHCRSIS